MYPKLQKMDFSILKLARPTTPVHKSGRTNPTTQNQTSGVWDV